MRCVAAALLLLTAGNAPPPLADGTADAREAISLLDLLATDADATGPAKVSPDQEQRERSAAAEAVVARVERLGLRNETELARRLRFVAESNARADETAAVARLLQRSLESRFALVFEPARPPDLAEGGRLYAQSCAACHAGNLPLETPAPDLRSAQFTPRHVFFAVGSGVPETPMPSFSDSLSDEQRWDLAFYVASLPSAGSLAQASAAPSGVSQRGFRQLATASDELLGLQLEAEGNRDAQLAAIRRGPFADLRGAMALRVPPPLELVSEELRDSSGAEVERAVLRAPRAPGLLAKIDNLARQMLLRRDRPPVDLSLLVQDATGAGIGQCDLIAEREVLCDVAPGIEAAQ